MIQAEWIYVDKTARSHHEPGRPATAGLHAVLAYARAGDVIVVHTPGTGWVGPCAPGDLAAGYHLGNSGHHVAAGTGTR